MLSVRYKEKGVSYHGAIDRWLQAQRDDVVFVFVQFIGVLLGAAPRAYVARPGEVSTQHKIPVEWLFSQSRIDTI
jgi:hypothetical protein